MRGGAWCPGRTMIAPPPGLPHASRLPVGGRSYAAPVEPGASGGSCCSTVAAHVAAPAPAAPALPASSTPSMPRAVGGAEEGTGRCSHSRWLRPPPAPAAAARPARGAACARPMLPAGEAPWAMPAVSSALPLPPCLEPAAAPDSCSMRPGRSAVDRACRRPGMATGALASMPVSMLGPLPSSAGRAADSSSHAPLRSAGRRSTGAAGSCIAMRAPASTATPPAQPPALPTHAGGRPLVPLPLLPGLEAEAKGPAGSKPWMALSGLAGAITCTSGAGATAAEEPPLLPAAGLTPAAAGSGGVAPGERPAPAVCWLAWGVAGEEAWGVAGEEASRSRAGGEAPAARGAGTGQAQGAGQCGSHEPSLRSLVARAPAGVPFNRRRLPAAPLPMHERRRVAGRALTQVARSSACAQHQTYTVRRR